MIIIITLTNNYKLIFSYTLFSISAGISSLGFFSINRCMAQLLSYKFLHVSFNASIFKYLLVAPIKPQDPFREWTSFFKSNHYFFNIYYSNLYNYELSPNVIFLKDSIIFWYNSLSSPKIYSANYSLIAGASIITSFI